MFVWLEDYVDPDYTFASYWAVMALIALIVLVGILVLRRLFRSGTYVSGGRNRKQRLAIMDATAIDTHRRLVLVRRDDVEHLILIGGHTDIVVESNIRTQPVTLRAAQPVESRPIAVEEAVNPVPAPLPKEQPRTEEPARPVEQQPLAPQSAYPAPTERRSFAQKATSFIKRPATPATPANDVTKPAPEPRNAEELDDDLVRELETALDVEQAPAPAGQPVVKTRTALDDEMTKLLGELKNHKS